MKDRQTEERIFEAATEVFEEKGLAGARMQHIADKAGINKALLHYYFRTKDHLFEAVFTKLAKKILSKFDPILDEKMSLEEKIRFFFREHISFLQRNPRLPGFILNEINNNPERIKKLIKNIDIHALWNKISAQHRDELQYYNLDEKDIPQIITTIVSISVFPFAARGIFETILNQLGITFEEYIDQRKDFAAEFVIRSLGNKNKKTV